MANPGGSGMNTSSRKDPGSRNTDAYFSNLRFQKILDSTPQLTAKTPPQGLLTTKTAENEQNQSFDQVYLKNPHINI